MSDQTYSMDSAIKIAGSAVSRSSRRKAFTLVEVMIAVVVSSLALLGLLGTSFATYKINHKARLRDNARAVLRTYVDQFQRLSYSNEDQVVRMLFTVTSGPTGLGLRWGNLSDQINYQGAASELQVDIGPPGAPLLATVTREVKYVNLSTGSTSNTRVFDAAGFMLGATFTVSYALSTDPNSIIRQSMSTVRLID